MAQSPEYPDLPWVPPRAWGLGRAGYSVQYLVTHYTAGSERSSAPMNGALYDRSRTDGTSTHYFVGSGLDGQPPVVQCVETSDRANACFFWGNRLGVQYELCGTQQTREQWLDLASDATLWNAAKQMARDCKKYGLPVRKLTPAEMLAGQRGICGHADVTLAYGLGDHMDPGAQFPWDVLLSRIAHFLAPPPTPQPSEEDDMKPALFHKKVDGHVIYGLQTDSKFVTAEEYAVAQRWAELYGDSREISPSAFDALDAQYT